MRHRERAGPPGCIPPRHGIARSNCCRSLRFVCAVAGGDCPRSATRRRVPCLPPAKPPHHGLVPGVGKSIRLLAIGESTVCGLGLASGDESVAATTARALARLTGRPIAWRATGISGATVKDARKLLLPRIPPKPADLIVVAFGVNDATAYRSPAAFADDLAELVIAVRRRVGGAAVVVGGVAPLQCFPALPSPLRHVLGWRAAALQAAAERLTERLPRLVVERITTLEPDLFAGDGFHPNRRAHAIWGEGIATLALPFVDGKNEGNPARRGRQARRG